MRLLAAALLVLATQGCISHPIIYVQAPASEPPVAAASPAAPSGLRLELNGQIVKVLLLADTDELRGNWLSRFPHRNGMPTDASVILLWPEPVRPTLWMKGIPFALDVLFVQDDEVTHIYENQPPCDAECPIRSPDTPIDYVVDLPAGYVQTHQLTVGMSSRLIR